MQDQYKKVFDNIEYYWREEENVNFEKFLEFLKKLRSDFIVRN